MNQIAQSVELGRVPLEEIDEPTLSCLTSWVDGMSLDGAKAILDEAQAQKPPNEAVIAAVGTLAYLNAIGYLGSTANGARRRCATLVEQAFPSADMTEVVSRIPANSGGDGL